MKVVSIDVLKQFNKFAVNWECGCRSVHDNFLENPKEYCPDNGKTCKRCGDQNCGDSEESEDFEESDGE